MESDAEKNVSVALYQNLHFAIDGDFQYLMQYAIAAAISWYVLRISQRSQLQITIPDQDLAAIARTI